MTDNQYIYEEGNKGEYRGIYQKSYSLKSALLKGRLTNLPIRKECVA